MKSNRIRAQRLAILLLAILIPLSGSAQNVSNYSSIPNPFLFLLREPAVHEDLELTKEQLQKLTQLNERFDAELLSTRNMPAEKGQEILSNVMSVSQQEANEIFTSEQKGRLQQITYRLRGISFVLQSKAAEKLKLRIPQRKRIETITAKVKQDLEALQKRLNDGKVSQSAVEQTVKQTRTAEQRDVLAVLTPQQQQTLKAMVGRSFDPGKLSHVSFRAPELSESETWINSPALTLSQLKGKVVALHFWAFG